MPEPPDRILNHDGLRGFCRVQREAFAIILQ